ncbi:MAG: dockerin type I repeat-containing protein [Chromatiales bacterium]|nr:dockerin type I repeat-containing protein [Chromatiales bacterium]
MRNSCVAIFLLLSALPGAVLAAPYNLVGFYSRSNLGALTSLVFKAGAAQGCPNAGGPPPTTYIQPCYNPAQSWTSTNDVVAELADAGPTAWDWNGFTLTGTGLFWVTHFLNSNPNGTMLISHRMNYLAITPGIANTAFFDYECYETPSLPGICNGASTAFNMWNVVRDDGTYLILATAPDIGTCVLYGSATTSGCPADPALPTRFHIVLAAAGVPDTDADGVADGLDNCGLVANPTQCDSDGDGYGNHCDGDLNNNGATNAQDAVLFRQQLGQPSSAPAGYNKADLNCNGAVNAQDTTLFRQLLGSPPGTSGLHP